MMSIKVVYNWIGPAGGIPNDEPPNLINLAAVTGLTQVQSTNFYVDGLYKKLFEFLPRTPKGPSI